MSSFLAPIRRGNAAGLVMRNQRTSAIVATRLLPAFDSETRRRGLLGRESLDLDSAMLIAPSNAIHTCFMRFSIDVAFVTRDGRVLKIATHLKPWRIAASWRGYAVVEMAAGSFERVGAAEGDVLSIEPA